MVTVYESLLHCDKCGNWKWWMKPVPTGSGKFPACSKCYPPQDTTELFPMNNILRYAGHRIGILAIGRRLTESDKEIYTAMRLGSESTQNSYNL